MLSFVLFFNSFLLKKELSLSLTEFKRLSWLFYNMLCQSKTLLPQLHSVLQSLAPRAFLIPRKADRKAHNYKTKALQTSQAGCLKKHEVLSWKPLIVRGGRGSIVSSPVPHFQELNCSNTSFSKTNFRPPSARCRHLLLKNRCELSGAAESLSLTEDIASNSMYGTPTSEGTQSPLL